jgi:hypothetical protein
LGGFFSGMMMDSFLESASTARVGERKWHVWVWVTSVNDTLGLDLSLSSWKNVSLLNIQ